jgi:pimeloyl-ACP methyl ester carboxylesterase
MQRSYGEEPPIRTVMTQTAVANGLRIAYEDVGHGSPAVVLIHGAFGNRTHYAAQIKHLAQRRRVLALDLRGHGESDVPRDGYQLRDYAKDVIAVCEAAGLDRYVLCGHSMPVALLAASLNPDRVAGVALLDGAILYPESLRSQVLANLVPVLEGDGSTEAIQGYLVGRGIGPYDSAELKARVMAEIAAAPDRIAAPLMRDVMTLDSSQLLTGGYPLLYVHARVPADLTRLRELRPDVLLGSVVGSGHWVMLAVPDQVNAMLDRFLQIIASRSPGGD